MRWSPEVPGGRLVRRSAARSVPGREVAPRWARPARRSAPRERLPAELRLERPSAVCRRERRQERRHLARAPLSEVLRPAQPGVLHPAQPERARRAGPAARRLAWSSGCPQQGASSVRRCVAAAPSSGFRRAVWLPAGTRVESAELAQWSAPAIAWRPKAGAALASPSEPQVAALAQQAESARRVASALRALWPRAEVAAVACERAAQPWEAAAGSGARVQPPAAEAEALDAAAEPQQVAGAAEPDAALQPGEAAAAWGARVQQPAAAVALRGAEVLRPAAEVLPVPWVRRPAAERPSAGPPWIYCPLPWPARRRAVRSAHAMRRSRAALPSKQLWQAARCEGLS